MTNHSYPIFDRISIECNSFCNRSCSFCTRTYDNRVKTRMPKSLIFKVLNELFEISFDGLISFHFYNEIFTDQRIYSLFEKCQELCLNNYIISNGDHLTSEDVYQLSKYNIKEFTISLYDWKTDNDYLELIEKTKERLRLDRYSWKYGFVQGGDNFGTRAGHAMHKKEELILPIKAACSKIEKKLEIRFDGVAVMCCQDYYGIHPIGNIDKDHILDIWYGLIRQEQINTLRSGLRSSYKLCSTCSDFIKRV